MVGTTAAEFCCTVQLENTVFFCSATQKTAHTITLVSFKSPWTFGEGISGH